jgi:hypothetical protein
MARIFPTVRQVVLATLVGLSSHPRVQNPGIYYVNTKLEQKIARWRSYGGYELEEDKLTCSVYPAYTSRATKGTAPSISRRKSIEYAPYTLGQHSDATSMEEATYTIIVELAFRDATLGESTMVPYDYLIDLGNEGPLLTQHGLNVMTHEGTHLDLSTTDLEDFQPSLEGVQRLQSQLQVQVLPAEELLREYMELIRLALNDMGTMRPFSIRSSRVVSIDFPTSSWTQHATDVLFHSAFLIWELSLYPPTSWKDIYFIPANNISVNLDEHNISLNYPPTGV